MAREWDYNTQKGKVPLGVIYHKDGEKSLGEKWPLLSELEKKKVGWKDFKK